MTALKEGLTALAGAGIFRPVIANKAMMRSRSRRNVADQARSRVIPGAFSMVECGRRRLRLPASAWFPGLRTGYTRPPESKLLAGSIGRNLDQ